ncbi:MAG: radical SAM protein [Acidobacteria bacterium]|nr:radical SAM protein [Acidobacteriota bacterium]
MTSMLKTLEQTVRKNYFVKKAFFGLLKSPLITHNPLYSYLYQKDVEKKIRNLEKRPLAVSIENTNNCNLSCIFCPHEAMERTKGYVDRSLFERIIDQCVEIQVPHLVLVGFGEPLLDKDYVSKVKFAKDKGIGVISCTSNGILLNERISEGLVKSGLDYLNVSIDAANSETYGVIHRIRGADKPNFQYDRIVENIENFVAIRKSLGADRPALQVRFKDFDSNRGELRAFVERFEKLADELTVYLNITNWPGSRIKTSIPANAPMLKFPCYNIWSTLHIMYDGRVAICCQDYECREVIGNLNNESLMDVWHGDRLRQIRQMHLKRQFGKLPVCNDCVINTQYVSPWWGDDKIQ